MAPEKSKFMKVEGRPAARDMVVKDNVLVHASYAMERSEKMFMWFVIWAFQKERSPQLTLSCRDVGEFIGMNDNLVYSQVWEVARSLRGREIILQDPESDRKIATGFINWAEYGQDRSGEIDIQISDKVVPCIERYIEDLRIGFTKFEIGVIASLKSFYSLRLYELCRAMNFGSNLANGWEMEVEELRKRFGVYVVDVKGKVLVDSYGEWRRFHEKVLKKAVGEVNDTSDLSVRYKLRKNGRDVVAVRFWVSRKIAGGATVGDEARDLVSGMLALGVNRLKVEEIYDTYGKTDRGRIEYALRQTEQAVESGKAKSPAAWFVAAIKRDDRFQGAILTSSERERERQLEAAERQRDEELRKRTHDGQDGSTIGALLENFQEKKAA